MALTYVKNATVKKAFSGGKGFALEESFQKRDGSTGTARYTAWFDSDPGLSEGQVVDVSGLLSVKPREYEREDGTPGHAVDVSLNNARLNGIQDSGDAF